jgi:hypothetical protein
LLSAAIAAVSACAGTANLPGSLQGLPPGAQLSEAARKAQGANGSNPLEGTATPDQTSEPAAAFGSSELSTMTEPRTAATSDDRATLDTTPPDLQIDPSGTRTAAATTPVDAPYLDDLVHRARQLHLAADPAWLSMLHYRRTWGTGIWRSEADGAGFFLAPNGKRSPPLELEATLRGFFAPPLAGAGAVTGPPSVAVPAAAPSQHALCQFPARLRWLTARLAIDPARLPRPRCARLADFRHELSATEISLVFSAQDATNPSNAFGRTFLRIHSSHPGPPERRELLDSAIEFSPRQGAGPSNSLIHDLSNLAGFLPGEFRRLPYYYEVRDGRGFDARDQWSYTLALTPDEVAGLVDHLWELGATWFSYDTTRENGSYQIANAIGAAIPRLRIAPRLRWPVLPADTVKHLTEIPGAIRRIEYQPAPRRQLRRAIADLSDDERAAVVRLAADPTAPLPASWPARRLLRVLDAAVFQVDVTLAAALPLDGDTDDDGDHDRNDLKEGDDTRRKQRLIERRSALAGVARVEPSAALADGSLTGTSAGLSAPLWQRPHQGHGSRRLGLFGGATDGVASIYMDARLAMHDLADPAPGYPQTSALELFTIRARIFFEGDAARLSLDHAYLARAALLTPIDVQRRLSVRFQVGAITVDDPGCSRDRCLAAHALVGTGLAFASAQRRWLGWAMLDGQLTSGPHLQGPNGIPLRLGAAPSVGLRVRLRQELSVLATANLWILPWQTPASLAQTTLELRWLLSRPVALAAEARLDRDLEARATEARAQFGAYLYF